MSDASQIRATSPRSRPCEHESAGTKMITLSAISDALPYRHEPLNQGRKSVRLLRVLRGGTDDPIRCTIKHFDLATQPVFVALSYMWDHAHENVPIYCNGLIVEVGQNLRSFLQQFRKTAGSDGAWLWIDALCINQNDISERNHQVGQMKDIYQGAALVIAWLGAATDDDVLAFRALQNDGITPGKWPWEAWYQLFRKSYWRRIWIIQEFVLGEETHLWCADLRADSDDFWRAGEGLDGVHTVRETLGWRLLILRRLWRSDNCSEREKQLNMRKLSTSFATSNSTDPRDYVYGFLGIAHDPNKKGRDLVPDYSKSPAEVLIDVVRIQCKWVLPVNDPNRMLLRAGSTFYLALSSPGNERAEYFERRGHLRRTGINSDEGEESDEGLREMKSQTEDRNVLRLEEQQEVLRELFRGERFKSYYLSQRTPSRSAYTHSVYDPAITENIDEELNMQDEVVPDHDFISHLMRKLGLSRPELATLILETAPDLCAHVYIIVAKDWRELQLCRDRGYEGYLARAKAFVGIFGLEACMEMGRREERGPYSRRLDFAGWVSHFDLRHELEGWTRNEKTFNKIRD